MEWTCEYGKHSCRRDMIESKRVVSLFITIKDIIIFLKITVCRKINAHLKTFPFLLGKAKMMLQIPSPVLNISYLDERLSDFLLCIRAHLNMNFVHIHIQWIWIWNLYLKIPCGTQDKVLLKIILNVWLAEVTFTICKTNTEKIPHWDLVVELI